MVFGLGLRAVFGWDGPLLAEVGYVLLALAPGVSEINVGNVEVRAVYIMEQSYPV